MCLLHPLRLAAHIRARRQQRDDQPCLIHLHVVSLVVPTKASGILLCTMLHICVISAVSVCVCRLHVVLLCCVPVCTKASGILSASPLVSGHVGVIVCGMIGVLAATPTRAERGKQAISPAAIRPLWIRFLILLTNSAVRSSRIGWAVRSVRQRPRAPEVRASEQDRAFPPLSTRPRAISALHRFCPRQLVLAVCIPARTAGHQPRHIQQTHNTQHTAHTSNALSLSRAQNRK